MLKVLEYINSHPNWRKELAGAPWYLEIKDDGIYTLLKYSQIKSDFSKLICREARGLIIRQNNAGKYVAVCHAFDKFFNYGETYAAKIDWNTAVVTEKIDGSIIKIWWDNGEWHISTNGTIDAFKAPVGDCGKSFGDCVMEVLGEDFLFEEYFNSYHTYIFELVHPAVPHPIDYNEKALYFLGYRGIASDKEKYPCLNIHHPNIKFPKEYSFSSFDDCIADVKAWDASREGVVVRDANFNRVKIKADQYLFMHYHFKNGRLNDKALFEAIMNETIDDILAAFPKYTEQVKFLKACLEEFTVDLDYYWWVFCNLDMEVASRKEQAIYIQKEHPTISGWMFAKLDNFYLTPMEWIKKQKTNKIWEFIKIKVDGGVLDP